MNNTDNKLIPELRFPEFVNEGEWKETTIESLGDVITGGTPSKEDSEYWGGDFAWITAQDFKKKYINNSVLKLTQKGKNKSRVIPKDSVLVTCIASIGLNAINKVECATNQQINSIVCNSDNYFEFVYYAILKNADRLKNLAGQTAVPIISKSVFEKFTILKPKLATEQKKIANCLSSLDDLITAHTDKLDALKEHKKGLMQNLFPQEGERVPKFRFREFEKDGEWRENKLNHYLELLTDFEANGSFADTKNNVTVYDEVNYAWYVRATDLENPNKISGIKYVDKKSYDFLKKTSLLGGELLITKRGEIGKVYFFNPKEDIRATVAPNLYLLKMNHKAVPSFFYYYFINSLGNNSLKRINASSSIGALYKDDVKSILLLAPDTEEQRKIADTLSSVDDLIKEQTNKIEQLKQHKKGLMQGLFPSLSSSSL